MESPTSGQKARVTWTAIDWVILGGLVAAGGTARAAYVLLAGQTRFDPWRHLALVRNLREGLGFSLFDAQPYLWHGPTWHWLCSLLPTSIRAEWLAVALSLAGVALLYALLRIETGGDAGSRQGAAATGLLAALCGPVVAYTCHLGPEALALFLALCALLGCALYRGAFAAAFAGCCLGLSVVMRTNFAFLAPLAMARLTSTRQFLAFACGGSLPVAATWLRNRDILAGHPWVFTWDGLATASDSFGPLSTLVLQLHPDIASGLRRLHQHTMPLPEWIQRPDGIAWELMLLMLCGAAALALCRSKLLIATAAAMLGSYALLDRTLSSNFFRIYLPLMPIFFIAVGRLAAGPPRQRKIAWSLTALILIGGARSYRSPHMPDLEAATPPAELLQEEAYMVASGFFHPDSLVYRFPEKRFIGMPLDAERFEEFRAHFPEYRTIVWHEFSVQNELRRYLLTSGRYVVIRQGTNPAGRRYSILRARAEGGAANGDEPQQRRSEGRQPP